MKRKSLVTGGAGFIGSHLVQKLLDEGEKVTVIDNLATGRLSNLKETIAHPDMHFVNADINDRQYIEEYFEDVDCIFHLAALADIVPSIQHPVAYHRANVDGTLNVLEIARSMGVKKLIYTASSSCYGIPDSFPTNESSEIRTEYPYALTKHLGERMALHWGQVYGIEVNALRLFNVYGPRARTTGTYGAVFGVFLAQKLAGKPFTIVGDGNQTRDFTYVTDVADAFFTVSNSGLKNEIFNVGSGGTYSINQLVELLGGEKTHIPKRPGEPDCTFADVTKIKEKLGWSASVSFEEGVANMIDSIDDFKDAPVWNKESIAEATKDWFEYLGD